MENEKIKNIEIKGVELTDEMLEYLGWMQDNYNSKLNFTRDRIAEAVCFIGMVVKGLDNKYEQGAINIMIDLSTISHEINLLAKPDI